MNEWRKKILKDRVKIDDNIMYILQTKQKKPGNTTKTIPILIVMIDHHTHTHTHTNQILGCHSFNSIQFNQFLAIQSDKWSQNTPYLCVCFVNHNDWTIKPVNI